MAGSKMKERAPAKKTKKPSPPNPSTGFKSAEFIGDSDGSNETAASPIFKKDISAGTIPPKTKPSPSSSEVETESNVDGGDEEEDNADNSGSEENSSSASRSPTDSQSSPTTTDLVPINTTKESLYKVRPTNGVKRKADGKLEQTQDSETDSVSGDEEDEEGSAEGDSGNSPDGKEDLSIQVAKENAPSQIAQAQRSVKTYRPPSGFKSATVSIPPASKVAELFKPSNLEGKQIWHITVPARVPIASIEELSAKSLYDSSSILSHEGIDYGNVPQVGQSDDALLLPSVKDNHYRTSKIPISSTLHIRRLVRLPNHVTRPQNPAQATIESHLPRHQQPTGLQIRFHPFGVLSDSESDEVTEEKQPAPAPQFRHPPTVDKLSSSKKRKTKNTNAAQSTESSRTIPMKSDPTLEETVNVNNANGEGFHSQTSKQIRSENPTKRKDDSRDGSKPALEPKSMEKAGSDALAISPFPSSANANGTDKSAESKPSKTYSTHPIPNTSNGNLAQSNGPIGEGEEEERGKKQKRRSKKPPPDHSSTAVDGKSPPPPPSSTSKTPKLSPSAPKMPLAEFSARLNSAEEAKAVDHAILLPTPGQGPLLDKDKGKEEAKMEKAKRAEEKKKKKRRKEGAGE